MPPRTRRGGCASISVPPTACGVHSIRPRGASGEPPSAVPDNLAPLPHSLYLSRHLHHRPADAGAPSASEVLAHRGPVPGKVRERLLNGSKWGKWVQGLYSQMLSKGAWCQAVNKEAGRMSPGPAG